MVACRFLRRWESSMSGLVRRTWATDIPYLEVLGAAMHHHMRHQLLKTHCWNNCSYSDISPGIPEAAQALLSVCIPDGPLSVCRMDIDITSSCLSFCLPNATAPEETISICLPDCWSSATWNHRTHSNPSSGAYQWGRVGWGRGLAPVWSQPVQAL